LHPKRIPHADTKTARVYQVLKDSLVPYPASRALGARLDLTVAEVRGARARVFRYRYLPAPAPPERRQALSRQRGSVWPEIEFFVRLGMRPAEVRLAVQHLTGADLDAAKIATAFGKRTRKGLPLRDPAERRLARIETLQETPDQREQRVALWLDALAHLLLAGDLAHWPASRGAWTELRRQLHRDGVITAHTAQLREVLRLHEVHQRPLLAGMAEDLPGEIAFLRRARDEEEAEAGLQLLRSVLPSETIPHSTFDRDYLITICRYLKAYGTTGERSLLYDPTVFERLDDMVRTRVQAQVTLIRARYE
jgi:hypothetical protein